MKLYYKSVVSKLRLAGDINGDLFKVERFGDRSYNYAFSFANNSGEGFKGFGGGDFRSGSGASGSWGESYDINAAVSTLNKNAGASSIGRCAKYVRIAMEGGGMNTNGRPNYACDYGPFLINKGFVTVGSQNYSAIKGDLAVFSSFSSPSYNYVAGHIQMYNGAQWVSDFRQSGFWPGPDYRTYKPSFTIYRWGE